MLDLAGGRAWPVVPLGDRVADPVGVARTFASYGGFFATTGLGPSSSSPHYDRNRNREPAPDMDLLEDA